MDGGTPGPRVGQALLAQATTQAHATPSLLDDMAAVAQVDPAEAPAWAHFLLEAVPGRVRYVAVVIGFVCLAHVRLATELLDQGVMDAVLAYAESDDSACAAAHMLSEGASHATLRSRLTAREAVTQWLASRSGASASLRAILDLVHIKFAIQSDKALPEDICCATWASTCTFLETTIPPAPVPVPLYFEPVHTAYGDALESLYYLVSRPALRVALSTRAATLRKLGTLLDMPKKSLFPARNAPSSQISVYGDKDAPTPHAPTHSFVIVSILTTMTAYLPQRSAQEHHVHALRRSAMQKAGQDVPDEDADEQLQPAAVQRRVRALVDAGIVPRLVSLATQPQPDQLRQPLQSLFLALVTEQDAAFRGRLIQQGLSRALLAQAQHVYTQEETHNLEPLQALAKLSVSTDPALLYGLDGTSARAAAYLSMLFLAPSATLLQIFEATLALTNLASMSPAMASCVAHAKCPSSEHADVHAAIVPMFLQYESEMLRCALLELLCNLAQDESTFTYWSGEDQALSDESSEEVLRLHTPYGRIRFLLTLLDVSDEHVPLIKAVTGLLATLSTSPATCELLVRMPPESVHALVDVLTYSYASPMATYELALRVLTIVSSLTQYAAWLGPSRADQVRTCLLHLLPAVRQFVQAQRKATSMEALQKQVLALALDIFQTVT